MYTHDVFIAVRQKSRQSTLCVVVKGIEKFINNVYEARHQLLKLGGTKVIADIPPTYYLPGDKSSQKSNSLVPLLASNVTNPFSPLSPLPPMPWTASFNDTPQSQGLNHRQFHHLKTPTASSSMPDISNTREFKSSPNSFVNRKPPFNVSPRNISELHSSGYQSMNCSHSSMSSLENPSFSIVDTEEFKDEALRRQVDNRSNNNDSGQSLLNDSFVFNFDPRVIAGYGAMNNNSPYGEIRTPTPVWQGLGLSKTQTTPIDLSHRGSPFNMTTSVIDSTPKTHRERSSQYNDVSAILISLGLEHHIRK